MYNCCNVTQLNNIFQVWCLYVARKMNLRLFQIVPRYVSSDTMNNTEVLFLAKEKVHKSAHKKGSDGTDLQWRVHAKQIHSV